MTDTAHIRVSDLRKTFGPLTALSGISFGLPKGESLALIGPSAAGKSVLLKCLAGLYSPDGGQVCIGGQDLARLPAGARTALGEKIGMLFQHNALFDSLRIWENVAFRLMESGALGRRAARAAAIELLGAVGLGRDAADLFPADLSGGMQKRVGIARAIAADPEILLLDNPTAGLDPVLANHIHNLIGDIVRHRGVTVITVTNEMSAARSRYHYLGMLHEGRLRWYGRSEDIHPGDNPYLDQMLAGAAQGPISMRVHHRPEEQVID